jgi:alpha-methylacyl-CoA racemase
MPAFEEAFRSRTRAEWEDVFDARDACVTPVLSMVEAPAHPHNATRGCFIEANGHLQVAPPVRFGRTLASIGGPSPDAGADNGRVLSELGVTAEELARLRADGVVG